MVDKKPRIRNGICGSGDKGTSTLMAGLKLPKSHKVFQIYSAQERVCNTASLFQVKYGDYLEPEDAYILKWFIRNLNCLGAFCYTLGEDSNYVFPESFLEKIEDRILNIFQPAIGDCEDFLIHEEEPFILLDRVRIEVRDLERVYQIWKEVVSGLQDPTGSILLMSRILNRLSMYLFNLIRYESHKRGLNENTWSGKVEPFQP